ncbi:MAG: BamA/TamA family outer membrane protein [Gammaproteobacteria bacterium]|nr:BamA/TamA family outer membrane protein [Gammaproteobacteria bacterium]
MAAPALAEFHERDPVVDPEVLEAHGAVIGRVIVEPRNIFDLENPLEDKWLYRTLNRFHIVTRPATIEKQLLFKPGDVYSQRLTNESERIVRQNSYINEIEITPVKHQDGTVDLLVETWDVWTLTPDVTLSRSGGANKYGFGVLEENLLGRGQQIGINFVSDVDRDTIGFDFRDNHFRGTRYRFAVSADNSTDGFEYKGVYAKPFYALDSTGANGITIRDGERIDQLYDLGEVVTEFENRYRYHEAFLGWSAGLRDHWARRFFVGLAYEENRFDSVEDSIYPTLTLPGDRKFIYPYFGMQLIRDHYETTVNFDQISRTEDRHLGLNLGFRVGYSSADAGSSESAWHFSAGLTDTLLNNDDRALELALNVSGRVVDGTGENILFTGAARYHQRLTQRQLLYASISGSSGHNLDIDRPIQLGGDTGLRGYPLRYQTGTSKVLFTAEHRFFTDWYLFRLFHVGAAAFFDVGRSWGTASVDGVDLGWLKDAGVGLRLGKTRMGGGVVHIDLAFPLDGEDDIDGVQLLLKVKRSF